MGLPDRVFTALLRLLPAEFRGDYQRDTARNACAGGPHASGLISRARRNGLHTTI